MLRIAIALFSAALCIACQVATKVIVTNDSNVVIEVLQDEEWPPIPPAESKAVYLGMLGGPIHVRVRDRTLVCEFPSHSLRDSPFRNRGWGPSFQARIDESFNVFLVAPKRNPQPEQPLGFPLAPKKEKNAA